MAVSSQIYWSVYLRIKINSRNTHWERVGRWTNENVDIHLVNVFVQNVFTWWISIKVFCTSALLFSKGSMSHGKELLSRNCHFTHTAIVATVNSVCVCVCVCVCNFHVDEIHLKVWFVYVYEFDIRFYPKRLTKEAITMQLTSKLTISYIEGIPLVRLCQRWQGWLCRDRVQA